MQKRAFLLIAGFLAPTAVAASLGGCDTVVVAPPGGTGAHDGGHHVEMEGGMGGSPFADAGIDYTDPGCPDAGPPIAMFMCDPYNQNNGDCGPGEGCYIFSNPPETVCGQEVYGAQCLAQGTGQQGAPCGDGQQSCAAGLACVVSGVGNQCVQLCEIQGGSTCPDGLVCEPIDVKGFGGCL